MPANEHVTMKMAELFNIDVVPHSLIRLSSGELSYITKRIDRTDEGAKIHMLDMFQVVEAFDKYRVINIAVLWSVLEKQFFNMQKIHY